MNFKFTWSEITFIRNIQDGNETPKIIFFNLALTNDNLVLLTRILE